LIEGFLDEATNAQEEMFGFGRTAETIRQGCAEGLSAAELIDRLIGAVQEFAGDTPHGDRVDVVDPPIAEGADSGKLDEKPRLSCILSGKLDVVRQAISGPRSSDLLTIP